MLENAVGDRICGGDVKSFHFRMLAECADETRFATVGEDAKGYFHIMQIYFTLVTVIRVTILINSVQNQG
jgi:hypothetical protein